MTDTQLIILVLGFVASGGLAAIGYLAQTNQSTAHTALTTVAPLLEMAFKQTQQALAPLGATLAPVHSAVGFAETLVDQPDDWVVKALDNPAAITALRELLKKLEDLTDGESVAEQAASEGLLEPPIRGSVSAKNYQVTG